MTITRYRKRPIEVDTVQWTGGNIDELIDFTGGEFLLVSPDEGDFAPDVTAKVYDELHDTWVGVKTGQHIVRGVKGELYPIAEDVLAETYEPAAPTPPADQNLRDRTKRYAAALQRELQKFDRQPVPEGAALLADAAMAVADEEIVEALRISDAATNAMRDADRAENARLRTELANRSTDLNRAAMDAVRYAEDVARLSADRAAVLREAADIADRWTTGCSDCATEAALRNHYRRMADKAEQAHLDVEFEPFAYTDADAAHLAIGPHDDGGRPVVSMEADHGARGHATVYVLPEDVERVVDALRGARRAALNRADEAQRPEVETAQPQPVDRSSVELQIRVLGEVLGRLRGTGDGDSATEDVPAATVRAVLADILADMQPGEPTHPDVCRHGCRAAADEIGQLGQDMQAGEGR